MVDSCPSNALTAVSKKMSVDDIVNEVIKDIAFYSNGGGVTLSGGEPLMYPLECLNILSALKAKGVHTAIETSGYFDSHYAGAIAEVTDLFLFDYTVSNKEQHIRYTGVSNDRIIENLYLIDNCGKDIILRCIMLNKINMDEEHINEIARVYHTLKHCIRVDLIPYHSFGNSKYIHL